MEVQDLTKEEQEKVMLKYSTLAFANLKKNIVQDLINNKNESVIYRKYPKEQVYNMLENPQKNEKQIRDLSQYLYITSSHYRRLVDYFSSILLYNYTIIPTHLTVKKPNKTEFKKTFYNLVNECDKYNMPHEARKAISIAVRDGVFFGLTYETNDSFYIKPFNSNYAEISSIEDGCYKFSIDLNYFSGKKELLAMYGHEITLAYIAYKGDTKKGIKGNSKKRYYEPNNGICIKADETDPVYSLPLFSGLITSIFDIEDYKMLQKAKNENDNYKVLSAKMDTDEQGVPLMDWEIAKKYYGQMAQNLPDGIGLLLSPFDVEDFSFQSSSVDSKNAVTEAVGNFWESAGTSSLLFGAKNATSSSSLTLSVKPDEQIAFSLLQQFERFINKKIKKMNLKYSFKVKFSNESIFNIDEYTNRLSKAGSLGMPVKTAYMSAIGYSPSETIGLTYLEEDVLGLCKNTWNNPLVSSSVQSGKSSDEVGRTSNKDKGEQLSDSGEATNNSDGNDR